MLQASAAVEGAARPIAPALCLTGQESIIDHRRVNR
jgi:hypothetical protein